MKKLLFLDFDGVLHPLGQGDEVLFSKSHDMAKVLENSSCKIVISSSWRFHYSLDQLRKFLPPAIRGLVCDRTGDPCFGHYPRYQEIKNYMAEREIADWRVLDDSFLEFPCSCKQLIDCNPNTGITEKELLILIQWLAQPPSLTI